jgi:hypothetical protein
MLHRKPHIENHLRHLENLLVGLSEVLVTIHVDSDQINKDNRIKQLKARIRQTKKQLATIAALETQKAGKAEAGMLKEAATKSAAAHKRLKKGIQTPLQPRREEKNASNWMKLDRQQIMGKQIKMTAAFSAGSNKQRVPISLMCPE